MSDLLLGDCVEVMAGMDACSVDAVVTDPPYGISFMGRAWDTFEPSTMAKRAGTRNGNGPPSDVHDGRRKGRTASAFANPGGEAGAYDLSSRGRRAFQAWCEEWAAECLRILKPGGHLVSFGGTRTYHRLAAGVEDAGFEIRDQLAWLFGSGFPKSLDVSKAIDKAAGAERAADTYSGPNGLNTVYGRGMGGGVTTERGAPITAAAAAGWGTALKPAYEPIVLARKPLIGTVAENFSSHGTGGLNIDGCRVKFASEEDQAAAAAAQRSTRDQNEGRHAYGRFENGPASLEPYLANMDKGRWPANVVLDEEAAAMLDEQSGELHAQDPATRNSTSPRSGIIGFADGGLNYADTGGASRFFYCAKTASSERSAGLTDDQEYEHSGPRGHTLNGDGTPRPRPRPRSNIHPTVKPIALMRWLARLITPPGGLILDPFLGSGTTGIAAALEGFRFVGIEREPEYMAIAQARIAFWEQHGEQALRIAYAIDERETILATGQTSLLDEETAA